MDYIKTVREIVENCIDKKNRYNAEIVKTENDSSLSAVGAAERIVELKTARDNAVTEAHKDLLTIKDLFIAAAEKLHRIDGSMNNADAEILKSGIKFTQDQLEDIVNRNQRNPFVIALARKYLNENLDMVVTLPLPVNQIIDNFNGFIGQACDMIYEQGNSLRLAYFLDGTRYNPEGVDLVE